MAVRSTARGVREREIAVDVGESGGWRVYRLCWVWKRKKVTVRIGGWRRGCGGCSGGDGGQRAERVVGGEVESEGEMG